MSDEHAHPGCPECVRLDARDALAKAAAAFAQDKWSGSTLMNLDAAMSKYRVAQSKALEYRRLVTQGVAPSESREEA